MSGTRKIAAILVADVVGYSRLAGADEERTLARLRAVRSDLIDPTIAVHHGRIVKLIGDGALVELRSVVDAVRCAVEIQHGMIERNSGLPAERRIEFRIGVHLGDVVEEADGDLMGDGVNIAARLEGIAGPGAICLSEDAYRQVKGRLDLAVSDLGPTELKNIADPIRVYLLQVGAPAEAKPAEPVAPKKRSSLGPLAAGIAVLLIAIAGVAWNFLGANRPAAVVTKGRLRSQRTRRRRLKPGIFPSWCCRKQLCGRCEQRSSKALETLCSQPEALGLQPETRVETEEIVFYFFARNPLISPDSDE